MYSGPIQKLAEMVINALVARGTTKEEATTIVEKLVGAKERLENGATRKPRQTVGQQIEDLGDGTVLITNVYCQYETEKAILVRINGEDHWIPISQIDDDSDVYQYGNRGDLIITEWLARKKGLV